MAVNISTACISCGACVDTCPHGALYLGETKAEVIPEKCVECGECIEVCPTDAITLPATAMLKTKEVVEEALANSAVSNENNKTDDKQPSNKTEDKPKKSAKPVPDSEHQGVWVFIEQRDGVIAGVSLELLGAGRALADKLGVELAGVLLGYNVKHLAKTLYEYGADKVYVIDHPILEKYRSESYMREVSNLSFRYKPEILLCGATAIGRDLASAVATELSTGLTADCTMLDIDTENRLLEASRPAFGGNIMATILCKTRRPQMATVRPKVMKAIEPITGRVGTLVEEKISISEKDLHTKVLDVVRDLSSIKIADADIVVAGGKGLGDAKGFQLIRDLAKAIGNGAVVGASRDAVEAGWAKHSEQVGQTGTTVTPKIYFAIGISGQVQHIVGMQNSDMIIVINKDPNAPIFQVATYGLVGDALEIVPKLIEQFNKLNGRE